MIGFVVAHIGASGPPHVQQPPWATRMNADSQVVWRPRGALVGDRERVVVMPVEADRASYDVVFTTEDSWVVQWNDAVEVSRSGPNWRMCEAEFRARACAAVWAGASAHEDHPRGTPGALEQAART